MNRAGVAVALALCLLTGQPLGPVAAATPVRGAVTWVVDHAAKTITVTVQLEIYPGCSGDPAGEDEDQDRACTGSGSQVTAFLATKIKKEVEKVWNGHMYRCYDLIVVVDVSLGKERKKVAKDRVGVRIDPSPGGIRDHVGSMDRRDHKNWQSNDPADRVVPSNDAHWETTWSETSQSDGFTYAHEVGHILGLTDTYEDVRDANGKLTGSRTIPGAPEDIMSGANSKVDPLTIDRLVERNRDQLVDGSKKKVDLSSLQCDYKLKVTIRMEGVNPAFLGLIVAEGTIDLKQSGPAPVSNAGPIPYEGVGNVAYVVTPLGNKKCTFGYEGRGGFPIGVDAKIPYPLKHEKIEVVLRPNLTSVPKDTLIVRPCPTGGTRRKVIPLLTGFYTDRLGKEWKITDWEPSTSVRKEDVADGYYSGHCRKLCKERDQFLLTEVP